MSLGAVDWVTFFLFPLIVVTMGGVVSVVVFPVLREKVSKGRELRKKGAEKESEQDHRISMLETAMDEVKKAFSGWTNPLTGEHMPGVNQLLKEIKEEIRRGNT